MRKRLLTLLVLSCCGFLASGAWPGAASAQNVPEGCETRLDAPPLDFSAPNIDLFKRQLLYYRCTRYDMDVALVLRDARRWVETRRKEVEKPAIVLDIDETSLSNWTRIYRDDYAYIPGGACDIDKEREPCGDIAWQMSGRAPAIGPTLALHQFARCEEAGSSESCKKVEVFFVTGRRESEVVGQKASDWTLKNLDLAGYRVARDHLYMRSPTSTGSVSEHKIAARTEIEKLGFTIIANIGDQASDLVGDHAERTFKVPNPFYFIP